MDANTKVCLGFGVFTAICVVTAFIISLLGCS